MSRRPYIYLLVFGLASLLNLGAVAATRASAIDTGNHFPAGQCTTYAASRRPDLLPIINAHPASAGWNWDGGFWDDNFRSLYADGSSEYLVDDTPEMGAVVSFDPGTATQLYLDASGQWKPWPMDSLHGHVGIVVQILNATELVVDDQNFNNAGTIGTHRYKVVAGMHYIHTLPYSRQAFEQRTGGPSSVASAELRLANVSVINPVRNIYIETESQFTLLIDGKPVLSSQRPVGWTTYSRSLWLAPGTQHTVVIQYQRGSFADGHQDRQPKFTQTWWPNSLVKAAEPDGPIPASYAYTLSPTTARPGDQVQVYAAASVGDLSQYIVGIDVAVDGQLIGSIPGNSGSVVWDTRGFSADSHTLTLVARLKDYSGAVAQQRVTMQLTGIAATAAPPCQSVSLADLSFSPSGPVSAGTRVNVHAQALWSSCFRALRLKIDGQVVQESGAPEFNYTWDTSGLSAGTHMVRLEAAVQSDKNWSSPIVREASYAVSGTAPQTCTAPAFEDLSLDPGSPVQAGAMIHIHVKATWTACFRAMRVTIDGQIVFESGAPEFTFDWNTGGASAGGHTIGVEAAARGDNSWSNPSSRSVNATLVAGPSPTPATCVAPPIEDLSFNPASPAPIGAAIVVHAKATWNACFRSMRLIVDGSVVNELGAPEFSYTWNTSGLGVSNHTIRLEVAAQGDNNWSAPSAQEANFGLQAGPAPTSVPCSAPSIEDLSFNPGSPATAGAAISVHAKAAWNPCFRAMRLKIDGNIVNELGSPEFTYNWNSSGYGVGNHTVRLEVAAQGDNNWSNPSVQETGYTLQAGSTPTPIPCTAPPIEDLSFSPASPAVGGSNVTIHAKATWNNCFRSMRLKLDGNVIYELGSPEFSYGWNTSGQSAGDHTVRLEVAAQGDNGWSNPSTRDATYTLQNPAPAFVKPNLASPSNGALLPPGTDITLQWNSVGGATQYLVEIWGGQYGGNHATPCGWTSSTNCHIGTMSAGNVLWHVKARDGNGAESSWSDDWNFTPQ